MQSLKKLQFVFLSQIFGYLSDALFRIQYVPDLAHLGEATLRARAKNRKLDLLLLTAEVLIRN